MKLKQTLILSSILADIFLTSGCASIVDGSTQVLSVQTQKEAKVVDGANCTLVNDKGTYFVNTPGTVMVHRADGNLSVVCKKDGMPPGLETVESSTKGMAFGNILAGGIIGAAIDMHDGAAYDYPSLITVQMGENLVFPVPSDTKKKTEIKTVDNMQKH